MTMGMYLLVGGGGGGCSAGAMNIRVKFGNLKRERRKNNKIID